MKLTKYLAGLSAFAFAATSYADVTVNITGATAFRSATLTAIKAKYVASTVAFKFAHDQAAGAYSGATRAIFIGTFDGVPGTTTIRCCFTGSVEGIRQLVGISDAVTTYYQPSLLNSTTAVVGGAELASQGTTGAAADTADIAFSDVGITATPYASQPLQPADPNAGVIVFTMLTNEGSAITSVSSQQWRALLTRGRQPLSLFTGDPLNTTHVFATGRNDGSGTRTVYLAESGYGAANTVKQYVTIVSSSTALGTIQLVPAGGVNSPVIGSQSTANASTVWGQDVAGNGGYNSGSTLRTDMGKTGASITVLDETGADAFGGPVRADLVTFLSVSDAATARGNGAIFCSYNGARLDGVAASGSAMTAADKTKVTSGVYTAWSYEKMYRRNDITSGDKVAVYDGIKTALADPVNLDAAGIALSAMSVTRPSDGGTVAP